MNRPALLKKIRALHTMYHQGAIPQLTEHEVHPDVKPSSRERYLYFTLPVCLNFQRNSPAMWKSALATWNDPETHYLYFPEKVIERSFEEVQESLVKHKLALQKNKHPLIWKTISQTLHDYYESDPRVLIKKNQTSASQILDCLQGEHKSRFPYLRGAKMANYWLYILTQFTDIDLQDRDAISIIPDTHVLQCSAHLGIADAGTSAEKVALLWKELLQDSELSPVDMHPMLWNWSRNNFQPAIS